MKISSGGRLLSVAAFIMAAAQVRMEAADGLNPSAGPSPPRMEKANESVPSLASEAMFIASCTQCHDAERSTGKTKPLDGWMMTVRRMAAKDGAGIPESQIEPIALYLATLSATTDPQPEPPEPLAEVPSIPNALAASSASLNGTISLLWRSSDAQIENEGFLPDVWFGAEWRPESSPFSAVVTACTTCHDDGSSGMTLELVEGSFRADLIHLLSGKSAAERDSDIVLDARAGRFIVPFGAYSGSVHPGVNRTLTHPLMYSMGRRVGYYEPVLPMPYADEGVDFHLGVPLASGFTVRFDGYAVNGLQEGGFIPSRSWHDNNSNAALGGRAALGSSWISLGGSYASGELQATGAPTLSYQLVGGDITLRYRDLIRGYYEYARREEDTTPTIKSRFSGHVAEIEGRIWKKPRITLLARYDTIGNSAAYGGATIERVTWGPVIILPGGSQFIINHEHWKHDAPLGNEDVLGVRWAASF